MTAVIGIHLHIQTAFPVGQYDTGIFQRPDRGPTHPAVNGIEVVIGCEPPAHPEDHLVFGEPVQPDIDLALFWHVFNRTHGVEQHLLNLVDIVVEIPISSIELVPVGEFHVGQTKVFFAAMDSEGDTSDVSEVPLKLRIPDAQIETALTQFYPYRVTLRMRRGPHRLAVAVIDEVGANKSFLRHSFTVGR